MIFSIFFYDLFLNINRNPTKVAVYCKENCWVEIYKKKENMTKIV